MPVYIVYRKSDNAEMTRYAAASTAPMEDQYPLVDYDHLEHVPGEAEPTPKPRLMTKLAYLRLFTQAERVAIRVAAEQDYGLQDYLEMMRLAEEISLDDPDTIAAVNMLESVGLIGAGRAAEILS